MLVDARPQIADAPVHPYSRFTNLVRLNVTAGTVHKMAWDDTQTEPPNAFIKYNDAYYTLEPDANTTPVDPEPLLLQWIVERGLRDQLKAKGFSFRGSKEYTAYLPKHTYNRDNSRFFALHPGFDFRVVTYPTSSLGEEELLLAIDYHVVLVVTGSIADLINAGLRPTAFNGLSARISEGADRDYGIDCRIQNISETKDGLLCEVLDYRTNDVRHINAKTLFMEPKPEIIQEKVLSVVDPEFDLDGFIKTKGFLRSKTASRDRFGKAQEIVENFLLKEGVFPFEVRGTSVDLEPRFVPVTGSSYPCQGDLEEAFLLFDRDDSSAVNKLASAGLSAFGPYTKTLPLISVALLGTRAGNKLVRDLVDALNNGTSKMPGGMPRFFKTRLKITVEEICEGEEPDDYASGASALLANLKKENKPDLALVYLPRRTADTSSESPYFASKPVLLADGLPSQMLTPYTINDPQWKYANIASAIFAKAGGTPWVLAKDLDDFDMMMGISIGERIATTRRTGPHPRFVSYANVFDRFGRWLFFESGTARYEFGNHAEQVATLVTQAVDRFKEVNRTYPSKIGIHYFKRFGAKERELIAARLSERNADIRIAFVTIDSSSPLRLYDFNTPDGSYPRGSYAKLNETELLLSTTGFTLLSKKRMGTPVFPKLTLWQWPDEFTSIEQVAQHVLSLTRLNYKALTPIVGEPVTMKYAALAATFMACFSEEQWKKCVDSSSLRRVPWFL